MTHPRSACSRFRAHLEHFIRGHLRLGVLRRASRVVPAELSVHVAKCLRCSNVLSRRLVESGYGEDEEEAPEIAPDAPEVRPRRWTTIALRLRETDFEEIREQVGRIAARRALRHLATQEGRRLDAATCAAAEIVDAKAAITRLNEIAAAFDDEVAAEMVEFAALLEDAEHAAESFEKVRLSGLLLPRPPALPKHGDRLGRSRVVAWAARMLDSALTA